MKLVPENILKTTSKLAESFRKNPYRSRLSVIWSRHWETIIAAIAALIVSIILLSFY